MFLITGGSHYQTLLEPVVTAGATCNGEFLAALRELEAEAIERGWGRSCRTHLKRPPPDDAIAFDQTPGSQNPGTAPPRGPLGPMAFTAMALMTFGPSPRGTARRATPGRALAVWNRLVRKF